MNLKILVILCLVAVLLLPDTEGNWRRRRRRRPRRRCVIHCPLKCNGYRCDLHNGSISCYKSCKRVCRKVCYGERELPVEDVSGDEEIEDPAQPSSDKVKLISEPLPNKFSQYDAGKDGKISFEEFKNALPHVEDTTVIRKGFNVLDKSGVRDSYISCDEFLKSYLNVPKAETC